MLKYGLCTVYHKNLREVRRNADTPKNNLRCCYRKFKALETISGSKKELPQHGRTGTNVGKTTEKKNEAHRYLSFTHLTKYPGSSSSPMAFFRSSFGG